jgi:dipeptidyl aminopeptidase/acylaminoacyl peptidase
MRPRKLVLIILAVSLFIVFLFTKPVQVAISTLFFIPQVFPQMPIKPLQWFTKEPIYEEVEFFSDSKKVIGKIYRPKDSKKHPALTLVMGVRTAEKDKPVMANFAQSLARIGFVTAIINLEDLEKLKVRIEEKETFVESFKFLEDLSYVDKNKITFVGISVGSSIVLKAAEDRQIADKVRAVVFFGGYFDAFDYFSSLITKTAVYGDKEVAWQPHDHVLNHFKEVIISLTPEEEQEILTQVLKEGKKLSASDLAKLSIQTQFAIKIFEAKNREEFALLWTQAPFEIRKKLESISPDVGIENVKTRLFILHDKSDRNVPYFESRKLNDALPKEVKRTFLEASLFEHVQPKEGFSWQMIPELLKLYLFIWKVVFFVS